MNFKDMGLVAPLIRALETLEYHTATPIQQAAIPVALTGRDILGCAQTGTGKTASFTLPILQRLSEARKTTGKSGIRALILAPTRELAEQITTSIKSYGRHLPLTCGMLIGGVNIRPQDSMLARGLDIVVATPGRLLDHMQRRTVSLAQLEVLVLDEADRMLDMGFIRDIRKIVQSVPTQRQTMLFSATLPPPIAKLAQAILHAPQRVEVERNSTTPASVTQVIHAVETDSKRAFLLELLQTPDMEQVIVFTRTKWGANKLTKHLQGAGHSCIAIHGNKSQSQRRAALEGFKSGKVRVLVATDIAARGLDVAGVSHVINFELPAVPEDYVHRIGRTGRASATGTAISLMCDAERPLVRAIERLVGMKLLGAQTTPIRRPARSLRLHAVS